MNNETYSYCRICGHVPHKGQQMNKVLRFWEPDDGWLIAALCVYCQEDYADRQPKKTDYAWQFTNEIADDIDTDQDIIDLLEVCTNADDYT